MIFDAEYLSDNQPFRFKTNNLGDEEVTMGFDLR